MGSRRVSVQSEVSVRTIGVGSKLGGSRCGLKEGCGFKKGVGSRRRVG